jgi:molybdopterin molybdotransferase
LVPVTRREKVRVSEVMGRVLADDVVALRANPPLPNTAVDGYGSLLGRQRVVCSLA